MRVRVPGNRLVLARLVLELFLLSTLLFMLEYLLFAKLELRKQQLNFVLLVHSDLLVSG